MVLGTCLGQDTLRLLNGNILLVQIGEIEKNEISFLQYNRGRKSFIKREKSLVFSFTKKDQNEVVLYQFNPEIGNIYKEQEMRNYLVGERHASEYYNSRFYNYISFAGGAVAGYLVADDKLLAIAAPFVLSSIIIIPGARVKKNELNAALIDNSSYRDGYKRVA